jgi:hypothetical protein
VRGGVYRACLLAATAGRRVWAENSHERAEAGAALRGDGHRRGGDRGDESAFGRKSLLSLGDAVTAGTALLRLALNPVALRQENGAVMSSAAGRADAGCRRW